MTFECELKALIANVDDVVVAENRENSNEFKIWSRKVSTFLINLFGENSEEIIDFKRRCVNSVYSCHFDNAILVEFYNEMMNDLKSTLQSYIDNAREKDDEQPLLLHSSNDFNNLTNNKKVFIVHGHDETVRDKVELFLNKIKLNPIILQEQSSNGKTIIEKIEDNTDVAFAIILYTPCDIGGKNPNNLKSRARQNVILEHGYLMAKLGREKVFMLVKGDLDLPSDISGIAYQTFENNNNWQLTLAKEMKEAGLHVDLNDLA